MPLTNATTDFQAFVNDVFQNTLNRNFSYVFGQYPHFFLNPMMTTYSMYSVWSAVRHSALLIC